MKKKYYHKPGSVATFWSNKYINMKVTVITITVTEKYTIGNTLIRLHHT